jgi:hypothetical protein
MEGLGLSFTRSPYGTHEQVSQSTHSTQFIEMTVDIVRKEGDGIIVIRRIPERTAHIHTDKQD